MKQAIARPRQTWRLPMVWLVASIISVVYSAHAHADRRQKGDGPLPSEYRAECGSCHVAYAPSLLSAGDWRQIMSGLDRHFGQDATVDGKSAALIASYLQTYAGRDAAVVGASGLPRITESARFKRKHREVPVALWRDPRVKSAANCAACHGSADQGRYSEHDLLLPELRNHH